MLEWRGWPTNLRRFTSNWYLKDVLNLTDGNLGAHLRKLEEAGYIDITRTFMNNKPHTYVQATASGRRAFAEHVAALKGLLKVDILNEKL